MSNRKPSSYINDILTCIEHIHAYTNALNFDEFASDFMVTEACLYNIQVIGEAASKIPDDIKKTETQIPWILIKGMRNRLIHEYFGTDLQLIWKVIKEELPSLKNDLEKIYLRLTNQER